MFNNFIFLIVGTIAITFGADGFIKGGKIIARKLNVSALIVGLTLGALGTSLPEMVISWLAAGLGRSGIAMGNVVGSNMANLGLAIGLGAILLPIPVEKHIIKYDYRIMLLSAIMLFIFSVNHYISNIEGAILVLLGIAYIVFLIARGYTGRFNADNGGIEKEKIFKSIIYIFAGIAGLVIGARLVVSAASEIAGIWGITETVIGITVVAMGTSLPEIAVVVMGSIKKVPEISLGTIVGSNIFNIFFVAGGASAIAGIKLNPNEFLIQAPAVILMTLIFLPFIITGRRVSRFEGGALIAAYVAYILVL